LGGKMFASIGAIRTGVSVTTDSVERAAILIAVGLAERAPNFHRSWVHLPDGTATDAVKHRLRMSCALIRAGLTRKAQAALAPPLPDV